MSISGRMLVLLLTVLFWSHGSWAREKPAPVIEATGGSSVSGSSLSLQARVARLERLLENRALVDLMTRIDSLQKQVQQLQGQVEEQTYNMDELKKRQRDLYLDIDQRLRQLEETGAAAPAAGAMAAPAPMLGMSTAAMPGAAASEAVSLAEQKQEQADYEGAFALLKEGRYDLALAAFRTFVQNYPDGRFAGNAQYWLGEANYVQHNFKLALTEFEKVVNNYPASPKRADALLKMGYAYQELEQYDQARQTLNRITSGYPNTTAANLARKRLQELKRLP